MPTGFIIMPVCPVSGEIEGDIHQVRALGRTNFKMLYSVARHECPTGAKLCIGTFTEHDAGDPDTYEFIN